MKNFSLPLILLVYALRGVLFLGAGLVLLQPCAVASGGFEVTGSLHTARAYHTATLLPNGMVLVAGGLDSSGVSASAELYDPASGSWSATGSLNIARFEHTATLLSNGMVMVVGGLDSSFLNPTASAELYDPASGSWSATGNLNTARYNHTATLLPNGMVLVAGGVDPSISASTELYDPASGIWAATGNLNTARYEHTATLLPNGMVLVAGGLDDSAFSSTSAELYDPTLRSWSVTGSLNVARSRQQATLLPNGMVLVTGGIDTTFLASAELYDPASGSWSATGSLNTARYWHTATLLPNGTVLVAGGENGVTLASAELYDPALGSWSATGSFNSARWIHTATLLPNGMALITGGYDDSTTLLASAELYDPDLAPPLIVSPLAATGTVGLPFSYQFEATGATSLAVSDLPSDLTFDPALRAIVGTPTVEGTFQVGLSASNGAGTTNATLILTIQPLPAAGPVIMSVTSATGRTGSPFNFQVFTSGGSSASRVTATGLPAGLSLDSRSGEISGTATTDGSSSVILSVNEAGITNTGTLQLTFTSDLAVPVIVSPNSTLLFTGLPFSYPIQAPSSDSTDSITYTEIGPLPPGLGLDAAKGIISGTPLITRGLQPMPSLSGGVVSNVQAFACNSHGCATQSILFSEGPGAVNISTRLSVGTGDNVLIGGFIIQDAPMKLVVRGIGPSILVPELLADPFLELHDTAATIAMNDNWKDDLAGGSQEAVITATRLAPTNDLESAILGILGPGAYTAILHGANSGTGIGLVEVYYVETASIDVSSEAHLANISTRGNVQGGDNVMIGGFINQGAVPMQVLLRGRGPTLGVTGALANPFLELHDSMGVTIATNDDWKDDPTQKVAIMATGLAPTNDLESALLITLPVGESNYTAIVKSADNTTGLGLVEAYFGNPCLSSPCP